MKKKILLLTLLGLTAIGTSFASVSYALFASSVRIDQGIGSDGVVKKSIYLCPNIWEVDSPLYVMHVYNSTNDIWTNLLPTKTVSITVSSISMECKVFLFDSVIYNSFVFYRENPSDESIWNQTDDIVNWDGSNNVYRIINWDNGYGNHNSGYTLYSY